MVDAAKGLLNKVLPPPLSPPSFSLFLSLSLSVSHARARALSLYVYIFPHTTIYVPMCPRTTICVLILLYARAQVLPDVYIYTDHQKGTSAGLSPGYAIRSFFSLEQLLSLFFYVYMIEEGDDRVARR